MDPWVSDIKKTAPCIQLRYRPQSECYAVLTNRIICFKRQILICETWKTDAGILHNIQGVSSFSCLYPYQNI